MKKLRKTSKKKTAKNKITKNTTISEILKRYPETAEVFFSQGVGCAMCHAAPFETLEQGLSMHGIDADKFIRELNKKIKK